MVKLLITKNLFRIHVLFYIVGFICFITGHFKEFIIFTSIILIHEFGHIIIATIFKWNFDKIIILPFGGITIFKEQIDKPLYQEFLIAIAGPLSQILFFFLFKQNQIFYNFNLAILFFNLLPIYPLDGSKIVNVLLNRFISFKRSHMVSLVFSYLFIIFLIFTTNRTNLFFLIIILFILLEVFKETTKHKYYFNKFLLERYLYNPNFKRQKKITKLTQMKKQTKHIFRIDKKYYTERQIIRNLFDK